MSNGGDAQPDVSGPEGGSSTEPLGEPAGGPGTTVPAPAPAPVISAAGPRQVSTRGYPIDLDVEVPDRIARWRPLVQWILAIPLFIVTYVLRIVAEVAAIIGWFAALFTGQLPEGLGNFIAGYYRYAWRAYSYSWFLRDTYPPFGPAMGYTDPGDDPAIFDVRPGTGLSRLAVLFRIFLVIPQVIAIIFVGIAASFAVLAAFFVVLFTGRWPSGLRDFVVGAVRWILRVDAWFLLLADPYPPFSLN
jgi:hypothetical protein